MSKQVQLITRVDLELKRKVKALAAMRGVSVSQFTSELLEKATAGIIMK